MKLNLKSGKLLSLVGRGLGSWGYRPRVDGVLLNSRCISLSAELKAKYCCSSEEIQNAMKDIKPYIKRTPIITSSYLDAVSGRKVFFKAENLQKTGSFKIRGATNAILQLQKNSIKPKCVLTHSSGNHGQSLAKAAQILGVPCYVVMPDSSAHCKVEAVKQYGAKVITCPSTQEGRTEVGSKIIQQQSAVFIHPSQNSDVIAGQGTLALEILEQNPYIDVIIAPVGGGGLISGMAIAAKSVRPSVKVIAAEPELANDCFISKQKGELTPLTEYPDTVADGARINIGNHTWPIIRDFVDDVITVTEDEIKAATLLVWQRLKLVIEPTSGVAVAAALSEKFGRVSGENVAVVLCGGNVDLNSLMLYYV